LKKYTVTVRETFGDRKSKSFAINVEGGLNQATETLMQTIKNASGPKFSLYEKKPKTEKKKESKKTKSKSKTKKSQGKTKK